MVREAHMAHITVNWHLALLGESDGIQSWDLDGYTVGIASMTKGTSSTEAKSNSENFIGRQSSR